MNTAKFSNKELTRISGIKTTTTTTCNNNNMNKQITHQNLNV